MSNCTISLIAAQDPMHAIGYQGGIPWHIEGGVAFFRSKTRGLPVIMGRKTYDWIIQKIGRPLRDRISIVLTHNDGDHYPGCIAAYSREDALQVAYRLGSREIFVMGGAETFRMFLPLANKIWLTHIESQEPLPAGDAFFPEYEHLFREKRRTKQYNEGPYLFSIGEYERNPRLL